jgi:hypothetical protein
MARWAAHNGAGDGYDRPRGVGANPHQAERQRLKRFLKIAVVGVVLLVVVAAIAGGSKKNSSTDSTSADGSTSTVATSTAPAKPKRRRRNPCAKITRSAVTSCPFALAVRKAYLSHPSGTVVAYSPVTHKTYTMRCLQSKGVAACAGGTGSQVAFNGPPGTGTAPPTVSSTAPAQPPPASTTQEVEQSGSSSHATDDQFCSTHQCIENFPNGNGSIVQCQDGKWSHSGGLSGACSDHGREA